MKWYLDVVYCCVRKFQAYQFFRQILQGTTNNLCYIRWLQRYIVELQFNMVHINN